MHRRDFILSILSFSSFGKPVPFEKSNAWKNHSADLFPINELLGLTEGILCGEHFCLRNEAFEAYNEMDFEASLSGIKLWCPSAYRDFYNQKNIWNAKFKSLSKLGLKPRDILFEIMKYSSIPGTSRHHWGTDIDIVDAISYKSANPLSEENYQVKGEYQFLKYWLDRNSHRFGFYEVYTNDINRKGFKYEPWHFSYAPLSKPILNQLLELDFTSIKELELCKGFECFNKKFFENYKKEYMLGINPILKSNN